MDLLRRVDRPRIIAEIKFRSPSAGEIRPRHSGDGVRIAAHYAGGGASAISVLADGPGFGGSPLAVRRIAEASRLPVLFKEFVLEAMQLDLAAAMGARYVLLIVRALASDELAALVRGAHTRGLVPIVEAADDAELDRALRCGADVIGVNARDLRTFRVDPVAAAAQVARIPSSHVAVYMSGVRDEDSFLRAADGRADALLIGEGLMRVADPARTLNTWLALSASRRMENG